MARIKIEVEVNLDPIPGWGYDPADYVKLLHNELNERIPHYHPTVNFVSIVGKTLTSSHQADNGYTTFDFYHDGNVESSIMVMIGGVRHMMILDVKPEDFQKEVDSFMDSWNAANPS